MNDLIALYLHKIKYVAYDPPLKIWFDWINVCCPETNHEIFIVKTQTLINYLTTICHALKYIKRGRLSLNLKHNAKKLELSIVKIAIQCKPIDAISNFP